MQINLLQSVIFEPFNLPSLLRSLARIWTLDLVRNDADVSGEKSTHQVEKDMQKPKPVLPSWNSDLSSSAGGSNNRNSVFRIDQSRIMTRSGGSHCQSVLLLVLVTIAIVASRAAKQAASSDRSRTEDYITQYEINTERYRVTTEDGYQLIVYRLLPQIPAKGVVLIQHGIRQSSADWLMLDRNLPMQFLSAGIEVWLGNSRASAESTDHVKVCKKMTKYWDFSFHEIGYYDLAAITDAALQISQRKQIHVVAFSEGSTATLVLLSQRPEYNDKIASLNLLAPAAFLPNSQFKLVSLLFDKIQVLFPWKITPILSTSNQLTRNSQKQLEHFQQLILTGRFRQFDYGQRENVKRYGTLQPPDYPLCRITRPVVLHYGGRDSTVNPRDVEQLSTQFPNTSNVQLIYYDKLDHNDFVVRTEAASDVYPMVVESVLNELEPKTKNG